MQTGRMAAILSGLGDDGFDMPEYNEADIPASQTDWSGDYGVSPDGTISTSSVYGNTGDQINWNWSGSGPDVQVIATDVPPADPWYAGIDPSKLVQTATGVYKYVKTLKPDGSSSYRPTLVSTNKPPAAAGSQKSQMPLIAAAAALFFMLR